MKSLLSSLPGTPYLQRALEKQTIANHIRVRGTASLPLAPRDVFVQSASRGVLVTWKLPVFHDDIAGWRIYLNTESNLAAEIRDKGTRQAFVPLNSGSVPPNNNIFVCAFSTLGRESVKIVTQGSATPEINAPTVPTVPPGYTAESSGGANRELIRFKGQSQYLR